jgi:nicotinate-nucleotide pyrophosphorylase (carboxylating)
LGQSTVAALQRVGLDVELVWDRVAMALDEDLAYGPDVTSAATIPPSQMVEALVSVRQPGVLAGLPVAQATLDMVVGDDRWRLLRAAADGEHVQPGRAVLQLAAPTAALLTAERTMLNFLCHLSGIATVTAAWVAAVRPVKVRDTRKTHPGLRVLQKYAVRCGGGVNHRMGLGDAALIKDNHVLAAGGVASAIERVRRVNPTLELEVEVDRLDQVTEAIEAGASLILLDNMPPLQMREAVELARRLDASSNREPVRFEASGGLTLSNASEVAITGVDYVAVGALTHSAPVLDLGLDVQRVVAEPLSE